MSFLDRTQSLIGKLDFAELRLVRIKSQIFLCGGRSVEAAPVTSSVREAFLRHLPQRTHLDKTDILLAERATDALPETSFDNLLDLEEFIAAIVDAVILIVESAGSICELGAFAKTEEIRQKLLIILPNTHHNTRSFITLGALKYIKDNSDASEIHPFDWNEVDGGVAVPTYALDGMLEEISSAVKRSDKSPKFDVRKIGHRIYLTLTFCHLLRGAKLIELKRLFEAARIEISEKELRKHLDTLQICGLVEKIANGAKHVHYISLADRLPVKPAFRDEVPDKERNVMRWISAISKEIQEEDAVRMAMFQEHNKHAA